MGDKRTKQRITSKIDELPEDLRMKVDVMLADTSNTYEYISQFLKGEGYDISKSSVGRYATRTNNAMQRLLEAQAQTDRLIQVVKENPEADYTEAAILLTMNGLLNKVATAEEEFNEMPLDKAGRLIASLSRTSLEVLQEFLDCLTKAAEEGTTKEQFLEDMNRFLEEHGYEGINPWKCDNIFRTNMQTALNAGHYKSMTDETTMKLRPYWRYRTAGDGHVRESHAVMEGRVYRADDPIWDVWYPPNGFRCRCMVVSLSKKQVERMGLHVETEAPYDVDYSTGEILTKFPDKGFSNNPAKTVWKPDMTNISPELRKMFRERKQPEDGETK